MKKIDIASAPRYEGSDYPPPYDLPCRERVRHALGDAAGLTQFGVNLQRLVPGCWSSQRHWHTAEDEFVCAKPGSECTFAAHSCFGRLAIVAVRAPAELSLMAVRNRCRKVDSDPGFGFARDGVRTV